VRATIASNQGRFCYWHQAICGILHAGPSSAAGDFQLALLAAGRDLCSRRVRVVRSFAFREGLHHYGNLISNHEVVVGTTRGLRQQVDDRTPRRIVLALARIRIAMLPLWAVTVTLWARGPAIVALLGHWPGARTMLTGLNHSTQALRRRFARAVPLSRQVFGAHAPVADHFTAVAADDLLARDLRGFVVPRNAIRAALPIKRGVILAGALPHSPFLFNRAAGTWRIRTANCSVE
jgi:hypothetical protein